MDLVRNRAVKLSCWFDPEIYLVFEISKRRGVGCIDVALCIGGVWIALALGYGREE